MLNLLIVDDEKSKIQKIIDVVNELGVETHIETAADVKTTEDKLFETQFDILILDLYIPTEYGKKDEKPENARDLLDFIRVEDEIFKPYFIIGNTCREDTEEFKEQMPDYIIQAMNGGGIEYYYNSMGVMMEIRWGGRKTTQLCRMLNIRTVLSHKQTWIKSTAKEWFAGVFSPFVLSRRTYPFGDSVNPLYLNLMWKKAPSLTLLYVNVGRWGFPVCIILLLLGGILCLSGAGKERIRHSLKHSIFFICLIAQTALSTILLSVPLFDFRNCLLPCMLWAVWGMSMIIFEKDEELFFIGKEAKWEKQH